MIFTPWGGQPHNYHHRHHHCYHHLHQVSVPIFVRFLVLAVVLALVLALQLALALVHISILVLALFLVISLSLARVPSACRTSQWARPSDCPADTGYIPSALELSLSRYVYTHTRTCYDTVSIYLLHDIIIIPNAYELLSSR